MYTIEIEKECGCFKKSSFENNMTFDYKEDAINKAKVIEARMNQEFCFKHYFEAVDHGDKIVIHSTLRPEDEDNEEAEDIRDLIAKSPVKIQFDGGASTPGDGK